MIKEILLKNISIEDKSYLIDKYFSGRSPTEGEVVLIKNYIQKYAINCIYNNNGFGLICMATGLGKSRIGIIMSRLLIDRDSSAKILLVVPTVKLRDSNWKKEFAKWGEENIWNKNIVKTCYASLAKIEYQTFDLVILDEAHNVTELNSKFFDKNEIYSCVGLTATPPEDLIKNIILSKIGLKNVFTCGLEEAVRLKITAPYDIHVVNNYLEKTVKNVLSSNKKFFTTEQRSYYYLSDSIDYAKQSLRPTKFPILNRMRFLYNLQSKEDKALQILLRLQNKRIIVFCASKKQAEKLASKFVKIKDIPPVYHSSTSDKAYEAFYNKEIDILFAVDGLNEGHDFPDVDGILIIKNNSDRKTLTQRIGRTIRFREGHKAFVIIIVTKETQEVSWFESATKFFDKAFISYYEYGDYINNKIHEI